MDKETKPMPEASVTPPSGGSCAAGDEVVPGAPLAMVYAPCQPWRNLYEPDRALTQGTLFADLDLPFLGVRKGDHE